MEGIGRADYILRVRKFASEEERRASRRASQDRYRAKPGVRERERAREKERREKVKQSIQNGSGVRGSNISRPRSAPTLDSPPTTPLAQAIPLAIERSIQAFSLYSTESAFQYGHASQSPMSEPGLPSVNIEGSPPNFTSADIQMHSLKALSALPAGMEQAYHAFQESTEETVEDSFWFFLEPTMDSCILAGQLPAAGNWHSGDAIEPEMVRLLGRFARRETRSGQERFSAVLASEEGTEIAVLLVNWKLIGLPWSESVVGGTSSGWTQQPHAGCTPS